MMKFKIKQDHTQILKDECVEDVSRELRFYSGDFKVELCENEGLTILHKGDVLFEGLELMEVQHLRDILGSALKVMEVR